ncbi:hypothetical protein VUR80DRAFT_9133 [Thermomyces stellatus]
METPFVRRPPLFFSLILEKKGKRFRVHISAARVLRPSSPPARRNRQQGVRVWQTKKKKKRRKTNDALSTLSDADEFIVGSGRLQWGPFRMVALLSTRPEGVTPPPRITRNQPREKDLSSASRVSNTRVFDNERKGKETMNSTRKHPACSHFPRLPFPERWLPRRYLLCPPSWDSCFATGTGAGSRESLPTLDRRADTLGKSGC